MNRSSRPMARADRGLAPRRGPAGLGAVRRRQVATSGSLVLAGVLAVPTAASPTPYKEPVAPPTGGGPSLSVETYRPGGFRLPPAGGSARRPGRQPIAGDGLSSGTLDAPMTADEFIRKWRASELKERSASQEHFIDLCRLLDEPTPADADPTGETYCFERGARRDAGGDGWADVWKRHHFAWEYKGRRANLDAAFNQLRQYALALENRWRVLKTAEREARTQTTATG